MGSLRDPSAAAALNADGLALVAQGDFARAEQAFRKAVRADRSFAAAHNNLGLVLLHKGLVYQSAIELSMAGKLNPRAVEPIINLGSVYESVGWFADAAGQYEKAVLLDTNNVEALGRLARVSLQTGTSSVDMDQLLRKLAQQDQSGEWKVWALARIP